MSKFDALTLVCGSRQIFSQRLLPNAYQFHSSAAAINLESSSMTWLENSAKETVATPCALAAEDSVTNVAPLNLKSYEHRLTADQLQFQGLASIGSILQCKKSWAARWCTSLQQVKMFGSGELHYDSSLGTHRQPWNSIAYEDVYDVDNLRAAYDRLKRTVSPGIDGRNRTELTERGLEKLSEELRRQRYAPKPQQREIFPTPEGGRPISIASTVDKVVQSTLLSLLVPVFDPIFRNSSHGFRAGKSCHTCLRALRTSWIGMSWLVQVDLQKVFNKSHHELLLKLMAPALQSKSLEDLMRKLLNAGYVDIYNLTDRSQYNMRLVMGSIISPLCNNVILHELDCYVEDELIPSFEAGEMSLSLEDGTKKLKYLRYADQIILGLKGSKQEGLAVRKAVQTFLQRKLSFDINERNSPVLNARSDMAKFLGALIQYG